MLGKLILAIRITIVKRYLKQQIKNLELWIIKNGKSK